MSREERCDTDFYEAADRYFHLCKSKEWISNGVKVSGFGVQDCRDRNRPKHRCRDSHHQSHHSGKETEISTGDETIAEEKLC